MTEPISTATATGVAALLGGLTLDLLGLPYLAVVWGFVGAMVGMMQLNTVATMSTAGAFFFGLLSTLVGAALGTAGVDVLGLQGRAALIVGSLVGGAGAFGLVNSLIALANSFTRSKQAALEQQVTGANNLPPQPTQQEPKS